MRKKKGMQIVIEVKLLSFADNMTIYRENPKDSTKKVSKPINEGKIHTQKIYYNPMQILFTIK